jgi:hypothetical protein
MSEPREFSMAIGQSTGTVYQITEGLVPDNMMLPPCSNQDLPIWTHVIEKSFYDSVVAENKRLREALGEIKIRLQYCQHTGFPENVRELDGSISQHRPPTNEGRAYDIARKALGGEDD